MSTTFNLVANDTKDKVYTIIDKETGLPVDLTNVTTIQFKFRAKGSVTTLATVAPTVYGTPTNGQISVPMTAVLASRATGFYEGEVQITYSGGAIGSFFELMQFYVRADFT